MKHFLKLTLVLSFLAQAVVAAGSSPNPLPAPMPKDKEVALALSAGPPFVSAGAGVYVLEKTGYASVRESKNGFVCLVDHRIPIAVEPQCLDAEGVRTVLPRILMMASLRAQGKPEVEIRRAVKAAYADGTLKAPGRFGVNYMLSTQNVVTIDEEKGIAQPFPPHVMFYALDLTNADLGSDGTPRSPLFVVEEKTPYALVIAPVPTGGSAHAHAPPGAKP